MQQGLKTLDSAGRVGGYLVVWGNPGERDLQGEYFTPETELGLTWYPQRPVLYQHGLDGALKAAVIGSMDTLVKDETGVWAEAQLDLRQRWARAVQRLIEKGVLGWSSGSLAHLVEVADDGHIRRWPIVEGSLTPTPAQPRRSDARTIKSAWEALGLDSTLLGAPAQQPASQSFTEEQGENMPNENESTAVARRRLPLASADDALKTARVSSPYDALNATDMLHGYMLLSATRQFRGVSERFGNALAHKVRREGLSATKADELSHSTQAGFGDEWVPELWSGQIWQRARQENAILPLFQAIEMPSNPFELPTEGTDPTVYFVPETSDEAQLSLGSGNTIPESKIGTGKVQLDAKKLALRVGFSSELVEDSVVPVLAIYREQAHARHHGQHRPRAAQRRHGRQHQHQQQRPQPERQQPQQGFQRPAQAGSGEQQRGPRERQRRADAGAAALGALQTGAAACGAAGGAGVDRRWRQLRQTAGPERVSDDGEGRAAGHRAQRPDRHHGRRAGDRQRGNAAE